MTRTRHQWVQSRREELGLTEIEVANASGLSIHEYCDVEQHADELEGTTSIAQAKRIASALKTSTFDLLDIPCMFCEETRDFLPFYAFSRERLVGKAREEIGLSREELADAIEFEVEAIEEMESSPYFLDGWPFDYVVNLAQILELPIQVLIGEVCPICKK